MIHRLRPLLSAVVLPLAVAAALASQAPVAPEVGAPVPADAPEAMAAIDRADLRAHAFHLASDELGGRHTATAGQLAAAGYIAARFRELGLEPLGDEGDEGAEFLQRYPVEKTALDTQATRLRIGDRDFSSGFGVQPGQNGDVAVAGKLVFLGYGRPADIPERFEDGEIPLVLLRTRALPGGRVEARFMAGLGIFQKAAAIARRAAAAGAPVVLFGGLHDESGVGEMLNYAGLLPGKPLLRFGDDAGDIAALVARMRSKVPSVFLSAELTRVALDAAGYSVDEEGALSMTGPPPEEPAEAAVHLRVVHDVEAYAVNAVAVLRGSDPELSREAVVFSAHMDHVGTRFDGDVFNGADDNASGSAALLEVAEAFAAGPRPRRSVVFLSVSGEELGLWGSEWFATHPSWPLEQIVANVNIDMIGRIADLSGEFEISITPSHRHEQYSSIARTAARLAAALGMGLTNGDEFYLRSDHYNFARRGVPVVFFCDGEHEDYHQVTDTADKLDYGKVERVARLAYWTGWEVAQAEDRPTRIGRQPTWLPAEEPVRVPV